MNSIERRLERLEQTASGGEIRSFENMMRECCKIMDALAQGVKLDSIKPKRFDPSMREGIVKSLPDLEQAMCDALENQEWLPLELTAQLILIYLDAGTRALLSPTLLELIEHILALERDGALSVAAE
jgi:hypothetical protein